jgi:predicted kinase
MAVTAQNILEQLRTLPPADRLRVVEQVVHEVATEVTTEHATSRSAIWADESESDFQAFRSALERSRAMDTWRTGDEPIPA